ncbi:MAG: hypothetical protein ACOX60_07180 [Massiliimalia sp.]|jgi:hypothetical protein
MSKHKRYESLYDLVANNEQANLYYFQLPDYMKDQICCHAEEIKTFESMKKHAVKLLNQRKLP